LFPNRWISTNDIVPWLPRSPDLTTLDFFMRIFKAEVYVDPSINLQDLKNKIQAAYDILREDQIKMTTSTEFLR